ncbi:peptidase S8/S53 domain-containing protein [Lactarius quietus]|nr:peptidase S8/S53 domain-containing protein [Lactarius quietus]
MRCPHLLSALFFLVAARPLSDPEPRWDDKRVMHAWEVVPAGWESPVTPPAGVTIDLSIALKPHDEDALADALYEVSNPRHPKYGAYLTQNQVAELVAPHPHTLKLVHAWLERHGVPSSSISTSHGGNWLTLTSVPVSKLNDLLSASYQYFLHAETNETIIRTLSYTLPEVLHPHVRTIVPTTFFGSGDSQTLQQTSQVHHNDIAAAQEQAESAKPVKHLFSRDTYITPSLLRSLYNTATYVPTALRDNVLATVGFRGRTANQADLSVFMTRYFPEGIGANYIVVPVGGTKYDSSNPSPDINLAVQYAAAMTYPTSQIFYAISSNTDTFLTWLNYMLQKSHMPPTISATYIIDEQAVPPDYAKSVCDLFLQLAARGASVLFPSGNYGVGKGDCEAKDDFGIKRVKFRPNFPASCPYVTAVGGTTGFTPETETAAPLSGGGFSTMFPRQPFQVAPVIEYIENLGDKYEGLFSAGGRGIPDVSAQALKYIAITAGRRGPLRGTSCASPTVAGIVSLLNDYQLSRNRPALGFLNPWLYGDGLAGLRDITTGSNPGCGTDGYSAAIGWDPVTGLGALDFQKLVVVLPVPKSPD